MAEKKFRYVIALGFFTNAGVTNDKFYEMEQLHNAEYEIIQCFSILFDLETKEVVDEYDKFIRPEKNPLLSPQCSLLTGVTQAEVEEEGTEFYLFMVEYQQWLALNKLDPYDELNRNFVFATFGDWDLRDVFPKQCALQELEIPLYFDEWINVERMTWALTGEGGEMKEVMEKLKLNPVPMKRGMEECRGIITLISHLLDNNVTLGVTSVIDGEGNFVEKEIKLPPLPSPSPSLSSPLSSSLSLSSPNNSDRPITKRSKARGKYPFSSSLSSSFSSSLSSSSPSSSPSSSSSTAISPIDPSLPLHLLPLVILKGKDPLKD